MREIPVLAHITATYPVVVRSVGDDAPELVSTAIKERLIAGLIEESRRHVSSI